jgi:aromatic ring-opening dioxygenase catalytic subunit (LigB family)
MPTFFLSHGGGPWPYLEGPMRSEFERMEASLRSIPQSLVHRPRAVLMISGHWEEPELALSSSPAPGMVYDFYGFPEHTYRIVYPAPGSPELAERARALLDAAGWHVRLDAERGYDHGTFSVLKPMFPAADVPVVQLSLAFDQKPSFHYSLGRQLAPLREQGVLIVGSGMSYHNLATFGPSAAQPSAAFDRWLRDALLENAPEKRSEALVDWEYAPFARAAHPREEHLLPLMVAAGAAGDDPAALIYSEVLFGHMQTSSYRFG